jgi:hypothetical protein
VVVAPANNGKTALLLHRPDIIERCRLEEIHGDGFDIERSASTYARRPRVP